MVSLNVVKLTLAVAYAPDASLLALVGEDGKLRLVDVAEEK